MSRQHPRDLFDCKYMNVQSLDEVKSGLLLCLLGSDKPILESLNPNPINQTEALERQFTGMSDVPFSYADYEEARRQLIKAVNDCLTDQDKAFLLSFEQGQPDWSLSYAGDLSHFPSVKWKLTNIERLKASNPKKYEEGIGRLKSYLSL